MAAAGKACGVPTPVNQTLNDVLLKLTRQEVDWRLYDGKPNQLVQEVKRYERAGRRGV